jgi:hypothetical protein
MSSTVAGAVLLGLGPVARRIERSDGVRVAPGSTVSVDEVAGSIVAISASSR